MEELAKYLKALVLLQLEARVDPEQASKPEIILSRAGLSHRDIADLLGKNPAAVGQAISRDKAGRKKNHRHSSAKR